MATKTSQRVGIWIIAIAMLLGTIGSFLILILSPQNQAADQARFEELSAVYQEEYDAYQEKLDAQTAELSEQYFDELKQYESRVGTFNADDVTKLATKDLKEGDGEALTSESEFTAYYIGWNPDGKMFDSSFNDDKTGLKAPLAVAPGSVIEGWTEGADGMKVGGVRELTIPSDLAYGEAGSGDDIPANTPLKFVIMIIPTPDTIEQPEVSEELLNYYSKGSF